MRFTTRCPACGHEFAALYHDSSVHDLTCPACGARHTLFIRKHRFEMLFDLGARALLAGYAREAVSSFAAAFERLLEFYVRATTLEAAARRGGVASGDGPGDMDHVLAELDATWKLLVSQSERQMGAFAHAYLTREGRAPAFLAPAALGSDFRNRVIHRGYLPQEAEVEAYAARLFSVMNRLLGELGEAALHMQLVQEREFAAHLAALPDGATAVFGEHPGMFRERRDRLEQEAPGPRAEGPQGTGAQGTGAPLNTRLLRAGAGLPGKGQAGKTPGGGRGGAGGAPVLNDAALFRGALLERGQAFGALFGAGGAGGPPGRGPSGPVE